MDNSTHPSHRENSLENYKERMLEKAQSFECTSSDFKKKVAKRSGVSIQYVRRFFSEEHLKNKRLEKLAFEELAELRADFQLRQLSRETKLAK